MIRKCFRVSQAIALLTLSVSMLCPFAHAEMGMVAVEEAPRFFESHASYQPLSQNRLQEIALSTRDYELKERYGLMDRNSEVVHFSDLDAQKGGLMHEVLKYQADGQLKALKAHLEEVAPNSIVLKSTLLIGTAYLFCNGKVFTTHLTHDTDLSGSAKLAAGTHALTITHRNMYSLGFDGGIGYEMDSSLSPTLNASVSKEILPHVVASVGQRRSLASTPSIPSESTGQIYFGTNF